MKLFITPGGHKLTNKKFTIKIRTRRRRAVEVAQRTRRRSHPAAFLVSSLRTSLAIETRLLTIIRTRDFGQCLHAQPFLPLREESLGKRRKRRSGVAAVVTSCVSHFFTHNPTIDSRTGATTISGVGVYCCDDVLKLEIKRSQRIYTDECSLETRCVLKSNSMEQTIWGLRRVHRIDKARRVVIFTGRKRTTKEDESSHHFIFFIASDNNIDIVSHTGDR